MSAPAGSPEPESIRSSVGILVSDNRRRGAEVQAERTAEGLSGLGWDVEFRSLSASPEPVVGARPLSEMHRADLGRFDVPLVAPTRRFLARQSGGVALAWGSLSVRYVAAASIGLPQRPQLGYVSIGSPLAWLSGRRRSFQYRLLAARYDFIVAVSEMTRRELVDEIGIPAAKVSVIPSGVPDRFLAVERQPPVGPVRVLFIGSLSEEKDPIAAVNAVALAADESELSLTVIGDGPLDQAVRDAVSARHLEDKVDFAGSVEDITPHLARSDLLLLTSRTEGLPGVLIEAAAAGLPVIAYDVGAVGEVVEDGSSGLLVDDRTPESAARALITLSRDAELRRRLGDRARTIAGERFRMESAVGLTDRLLLDQLT